MFIYKIYSWVCCYQEKWTLVPDPKQNLKTYKIHTHWPSLPIQGNLISDELWLDCLLDKRPTKPACFLPNGNPLTLPPFTGQPCPTSKYLLIGKYHTRTHSHNFFLDFFNSFIVIFFKFLSALAQRNFYDFFWIFLCYISFFGFSNFMIFFWIF